MAVEISLSTLGGGGHFGYGRKREGLQPEYGQPGGWPPSHLASDILRGRAPRTCVVTLFARATPACRKLACSKEHSLAYQWNTSELMLRSNLCVQ